MSQNNNDNNIISFFFLLVHYLIIVNAMLVSFLQHHVLLHNRPLHQPMANKQLLLQLEVTKSAMKIRIPRMKLHKLLLHWLAEHWTLGVGPKFWLMELCLKFTMNKIWKVFSNSFLKKKEISFKKMSFMKPLVFFSDSSPLLVNIQ